MNEHPPVQAMDVSHLLTRAVRQFPDKVAVRDQRASLTFAQVHRKSAGLAAAFVEAGAKPGDRVAIVLPNCCEFIVAEMAVMRCAMVKVPLNIRFHLKEVMYALQDCAPSIVVCEASFARDAAPLLRALGSLRAVVTLDRHVDGSIRFEDAVERAGSDVPVPYAPHAPILIRYTGGTTGRPKGIVHAAHSYYQVNLDAARELGFRANDVAAHVGHLSHGLNFMWLALFAVGATQVLYEAFEPGRILADIERDRISFIYMVPTMVHRLLAGDDGRRDVSSLRTFMYASAPMPVPLLRAAIKRFGPIFMQVYTLSESPVVTAVLQPWEHEDLETQWGNRLASCGREAVNVRIRLVDEAGAEVAAGQVGELAIYSPGTMAGYWNLPEQTAEVLGADGWLRTGDMGRRDAQGFLYLVDRKKDLIITGALNVYPKEVEDVLLMHGAVSQAAVVGVPDVEWGERIRAYVVLHEGRAADESDLVEHCRAHLASYKKPREVRFVKALPLTPVGKVSRAQLRDMALRDAN